MPLALIVAAAENGVIGRDNALPWRLPGDMQYFRRMTMGKPVIMGRRTYDSIGKPLPGRANIVITRSDTFAAEGVKVVHSLDEARALAADIALIDGAEEAVVIGGAEIYREALPLAARLYLTRVHADVPGDVYLPEIDFCAWREVSRERTAAAGPNPFDYSFIVYER
ncbi:MAG: dihydrofolate reductase [Halioglobus sp.]|nr:dihydrofolate reductase [Halioglobus sp.]